MEDYKIANDQLNLLIGGRNVAKIDDDGDGKWDIKIVYRNDGSVKKVVLR